jgi:hypothetical protein
MCGTIPAIYSMIRQPSVIHNNEISSQFIPVVRAHGAVSVEMSYATKIHFRTVPAGYYAEA